MDWWEIVGTIASVVGLGVGVYVLCVARDARTAAQQARVLASKRSLAEELGQATKYAEQVGDFLNKREWTAARIRAQEIMTSCSESLTRWPNGLSEQRRDDVLNAKRLVNSIADMAGDPEVNDFKPAKLKRLSGIQLQAAGLLSGALGEARSRAEEDGG